MKKSAALAAEIRRAIDGKTKPLGSLGQLEEIAFRVAMIQGTTTPQLSQPAILVFAGDHGITAEGVSAYPSDVTWQMVHNFLSGGAAINVFARQNGLSLHVVDAGVDHDFANAEGMFHCKQGRGSANFRRGQSLSEAQLDGCLKQGAILVDTLAEKGTNILGFGEMGIGNTSAAAILMSQLCDLPIDECTGRGAGLDDEALVHKTRVLADAIEYHGSIKDPHRLLLTYAGLEMAMMCGAMLRSQEKGMTLLIDGFIVTSVLLVAAAIQPEILDQCLFAHTSDEHGHGAMLKHLQVTPLLQLNMRLGEGTGAALAYPLVQAAVNFLNQMASFESAGVSTADA